jgi:glycosyltransferase involved in cell wall biosynthesis
VVKRVAFAVPGDLATPTGGYAYDRRMIAELERLGWEVDVVDLGAGFPRPDREQRERARERLIQIPGGRPIVVDGLAYGVIPDIAAELSAEHPLIALVHHPLAFESGLSAEDAERFRRLERAALGAAAGIIVTSATTAHLLRSEYGVASDRIAVARPGVDPVARARGSEDGIARLLAIGAIVPRKGYDVLIAALARLRDLRWHLTIAGDRARDAHAAAQLDADIARCHLAERVAVLGAVSDECIRDLYAGADIFALPSRYEGYGMVFAEAIAHGLPVIATRAGAIPEAVPAEASILVDPDDIPALASALRRVISDPSERQRLASAARQAASRLPKWEESAKIFAGVLDSLA